VPVGSFRSSVTLAVKSVRMPLPILKLLREV
jgi:hypothetical protein